MKRSYTRAKYLAKVSMARRLIPGLAVTTDIIIGFPGETEEDFQQTLSLVKQVRFDSAYVFQFSPRPGTEAASMPGHLPKAVIQDRFDRLAETQEAISWEKNLETIGSLQQVMVEGPSKKDPLRRSGRTRTNKLVHFDGDQSEGKLADVLITAASPYHLDGVLRQ